MLLYSQPVFASGDSRGYLTTPQELEAIAAKAEEGIEPYASAVEYVLHEADDDWDYDIDREEDCSNANRPRWLDNTRGIPIIYGSALAYHLTGDEDYAEKLVDILEDLMSEMESVSLDENRCRLTFSWGIPEIVASADLIEAYWQGRECRGPSSFINGENDIESGDCKILFQNWLAKNAYYLVSIAGEQRTNNWGAAATNAMAYIADYLWDRPDVVLINRLNDDGEVLKLSPAEAYRRANQIMFDRMNGYRYELNFEDSCDLLAGEQQNPDWEPIKSQITELGIIPDEARREAYCNIPLYDEAYQNYPQLHLGLNIQQCELMLRRGDSSCYDNIVEEDMVFEYLSPEGESLRTTLYAGRGSIERGINAVIVDAGMEWRHDGALELAYRYYLSNSRFGDVSSWFDELDRPSRCDQDLCFGTLTHGFASNEIPLPPPTTAPPN